MSLEDLRAKIGSVIGNYLTGYDKLIVKARCDKKLFRDPIFGFQSLSPHEVLVVDSPLFQRLRGITQTGFAYLTYPASIHTRFEHSLNCLNLATRILDALKNEGTTISDVNRAEVRLAALLHDVGHCIFSHSSEFFYREFPELQEALNDAEVSSGNRQESELINYCIITSEQFKSLLWEPIVKNCRESYDFIGQIKLRHIAQMIIGMPPDNSPEHRFLTEIINGPLDVDKLDYLTRDAYFTGISISVDIDRLLPSLRAVLVLNEELNRNERRLVVDHRGIAVVEQLLFARMVLYDTVYHHHKVRAANSFFQIFLKEHCEKDVWPTTTMKLNSISDLLEIDEFKFLGHNYTTPAAKKFIQSLHRRILPERALVIAPRTLVDGGSHIKWSGHCIDYVNREDPISSSNSQKFLDRVKNNIVRFAQEAGATGIKIEDIMIDIPEPPKYGRLGSDTLIQIVDEYVEPLKRIFPFQKVMNNYSAQYKYRSYIFSNPQWTDYVAYASFMALNDEGIKLNDLSFILSHQEKGKARDLIIGKGLTLPDWRTDFYAPEMREDT